jgi:hypothetical protein
VINPDPLATSEESRAKKNTRQLKKKRPGSRTGEQN